jgi:hypothetical protein
MAGVTPELFCYFAVTHDVFVLRFFSSVPVLGI